MSEPRTKRILPCGHPEGHWGYGFCLKDHPQRAATGEAEGLRARIDELRAHPMAYTKERAGFMDALDAIEAALSLPSHPEAETDLYAADERRREPL